MSRSYKKTPTVVVKTPENKKFANRRVRRADIDDSPHEKGGYRKAFPTDTIIDHRDTMTREEAIQKYEYMLDHPNDYTRELRKYPTLKGWLRYWYTTYKRK